MYKRFKEAIWIWLMVIQQNCKYLNTSNKWTWQRNQNNKEFDKYLHNTKNSTLKK